MVYLLALIGAAALIFLAWKAFGPQRPTPRLSGPLGPDDDPDFLRGIRRPAHPPKTSAEGDDDVRE